MDDSPPVSLICTQCKMLYEIPKKLRCQHTFCEHCLLRLHENDSSSNIINCPICGCEIELNHWDDDSIMKTIIDIYKRNPKELQTCGECEDNIDCIGFCIECKYVLCLECWNHHMKYKKTRKHKIHTFEWQDEDLLICEEHNERMNWFCDHSDCQIVICIMCVKQKHKQHTIRSVYDQAKLYFDNITKFIESNKDQQDKIVRRMAKLKENEENICKEFEDNIDLLKNMQINFNRDISKVIRDKATEEMSRYSKEIQTQLDQFAQRQLDLQNFNNNAHNCKFECYADKIISNYDKINKDFKRYGRPIYEMNPEICSIDEIIKEFALAKEHLTAAISKFRINISYESNCYIKSSKKKIGIDFIYDTDMYISDFCLDRNGENLYFAEVGFCKCFISKYSLSEDLKKITINSLWKLNLIPTETGIILIGESRNSNEKKLFTVSCDLKEEEYHDLDFLQPIKLISSSPNRDYIFIYAKANLLFRYNIVNKECDESNINGIDVAKNMAVSQNLEYVLISNEQSRCFLIAYSSEEILYAFNDPYKCFTFISDNFIAGYNTANDCLEFIDVEKQEVIEAFEKIKFENTDEAVDFKCTHMAFSANCLNLAIKDRSKCYIYKLSLP